MMAPPSHGRAATALAAVLMVAVCVLIGLALAAPIAFWLLTMP